MDEELAEDHQQEGEEGADDHPPEGGEKVMEGEDLEIEEK
jgi:hypothetical protein